MLRQGPDPQKNTMTVRVAKSTRDSDGNWAHLHSPARPALQILGQRPRVSLRACHKQPSTSACTLPDHSSQQCLCSQPRWQGTVFYSNRMKPKRRKPNLKKCTFFWLLLCGFVAGAVMAVVRQQGNQTAELCFLGVCGLTGA